MDMTPTVTRGLGRRRRLRVSVAGVGKSSVFVREAAAAAPPRSIAKPGKGIPQAVRAVLEDNIGELVEVRDVL